MVTDNSTKTRALASLDNGTVRDLRLMCGMGEKRKAIRGLYAKHRLLCRLAISVRSRDRIYSNQ